MLLSDVLSLIQGGSQDNSAGTWCAVIRSPNCLLLLPSQQAAGLTLFLCSCLIISPLLPFFHSYFILPKVLRFCESKCKIPLLNLYLPPYALSSLDIPFCDSTWSSPRCVLPEDLGKAQRGGMKAVVLRGATPWCEVLPPR